MRVKFPLIILFADRLLHGLALAVAALVIVVTASSFCVTDNRGAKLKQVNLLIRRMGDQLLLQSGDKDSRVLPVTEKKDGIFVLHFEKDLRFNHDSLIALSRRLLPKAQFPSGYTVTVHDCRENAIVYGFELNNKTSDVLACSGRNQPPGCYTIEFAFADFDSKAGISASAITEFKEKPFTSPLMLAAYGLVLVLASVFVAKRFKKRSDQSPDDRKAEVIKEELAPELPALGKFLFDVKGQRLLFGNEITDLTDKECRILELLHENFGELIPRETLMQKIWIDEGVLTGRSLDMFISKLRKKLSRDGDLRIMNVHGKGYRLEGV
ncbi:MAG: winged helix family transcriptional regulator [Chitinophagaceae bacterium]|nr:MAG: winged helix family transcriptional regulator [Chitinophagaceae bacterium]